MARTVTISQRELQRVAAAAYEGKTVKVMLCNVGSSGFNSESTVSNWQSVELSGNGYSRYSATVGIGSYDSGVGAYVIPDINAAFTASGSGWTHDAVVVYFNGETYPHSLTIESPNIAVAAGQTHTYKLSLQTDY